MAIESDFSSNGSTAGGNLDQVLAIVGVGLLGGSVALAAKVRGVANRVIGIGRNEKRLQEAVDAGVIDEFLTELPDRDAPWTIVVIGTPVDRITEDVLRIAAVSRPGTLITDVGSIKGSICEAVQAAGLPDGVSFVGAHPLAGSHETGFEAARADLFNEKVTVVTPNPESDKATGSAIRSFWEQLGSRVIEMSPADHDTALATTSHLPHVAASVLSAVLPDEFRQLAATGFCDTTRIAAGDPDLWVAILRDNADAVSASLAAFSESFGKFQAAIENRDAGELKKLLQVAKRNRDALSEP
ncbi:MAG: prephenate dehydrogenase [Planctomycetales bacterium]